MHADTAPSRVVFMGSKRLGVRSLEALALLPDVTVAAVTLDDRDDVRSAYDDFTATCGARGIPCTVARTRADASAALRRHEPDICVVCGWYWMVAPSDLASVPAGFVGVHFSALPKYRGGSPLVWQMINGEPEVGISLFSFADGVDEGPVWAQRLLPVGPDETIGDVLPRLEDAAVQLLTTHVPRILKGDVHATPQDHSRATYCALRRPEDGEISWERSAREVHDFIRAQSKPYPGAFTSVERKRITIWRSRLAATTYYGTPGQIVQVTPDGVWIVCGDHHPLIVERVGTDGTEVPAPEVLRSISLRLHSVDRSR